MAPRPNWKGYLKLSLVSCAIALYPATSSSARVTFNTLNGKTGNRVKRQFVDAETGDVVETEDQVKGYPVGKDNFIIVDDAELDAIKIESTQTIDIVRFVPEAEVDMRYLDAPYYLAPEDRVSEEAFAVIRDAMRDKKVAGLGRVVMGRRERTMLLRPLDKGIVATTMRFANEVREPAVYFEEIADIKLPAEMRELAEVIIDKKMAHFDPSTFEDRYENAVLDLLKSKELGRPAAAAPAAAKPHNVVNIMEALRRSIEAERASPAAAPAPAEKPKAPSKTRTAKPASDSKINTARTA
jgi:DNA end-binding protein Ku